ncbi:MAG: ssl1498 family light-harvesting-like protein [Pleurocapsa sp. SU_5_0]|nr:ssl1498 family light-harvesting-like protein [Pleurocapsa sp. SU_5_0]NJR45841.1 ssl1498 family light-harvesting-like protein [Hyellaceae cyanobacterium CSU_1_1]
MTTISDENGILNNFAKEPAMYYAEAPSSQDKRGYVIWGAIALLVVIASISTAAVVS